MIGLKKIISKKCRPWRALYRDIFNLAHFLSIFYFSPLDNMQIPIRIPFQSVRSFLREYVCKYHFIHIHLFN